MSRAVELTSVLVVAEAEAVDEEEEEEEVNSVNVALAESMVLSRHAEGVCTL